MQRTDSDKIRGTFDAQIIPKSRHGAFIARVQISILLQQNPWGTQDGNPI